MENYKLRSDNDWVIRLSDNAQVHSGNTEYLDWRSEGNAPLPADPPTPDDLRNAIQAQIDALEAKYHMNRFVREAMLLISVQQATAVGLTEEQLYVANLGYRNMKDHDAEITALRSAKEAIV